jgi:signal transduction histidine kinase
VIFLALTGGGVFLSIMLSRHYPIIFFVLVILLTVPQMVVFDYPTASWLVIPIAVYNVARWMAPRYSRISIVVSLIVTAMGPARWIARGTSGAELGTLMILLGISGAGVVTTAYSLARRKHEVEAARAQQMLRETDVAQLQLAEQAARQRSVETRIRTGIARELHDIVAHSISVMVIQAEGGLA